MAQLVEYDLAKVGVAGSNPVCRSVKEAFRVIEKSFYLHKYRNVSLQKNIFGIVRNLRIRRIRK